MRIGVENLAWSRILAISILAVCCCAHSCSIYGTSTSGCQLQEPGAARAPRNAHKMIYCAQMTMKFGDGMGQSPI
jgi:hypothetical protein